MQSILLLCSGTFFSLCYLSIILYFWFYHFYVVIFVVINANIIILYCKTSSIEPLWLWKSYENLHNLLKPFYFEIMTVYDHARHTTKYAGKWLMGLLNAPVKQLITSLIFGWLAFVVTLTLSPETGVMVRPRKKVENDNEERPWSPDSVISETFWAQNKTA